MRLGPWAGWGGGQGRWRSPSTALRTPRSQACTLLLLVLFIYDVFFVFITPFLTKVGSGPRPAPPALDPAFPRLTQSPFS